MTHKFKFKTGVEVKDKVSGVSGIINAASIWLNGCIQYSVQPKKEENKNTIPDSWWIDEQQIELIGDGINVKKASTGGPSTRSPRS